MKKFLAGMIVFFVVLSITFSVSADVKNETDGSVEISGSELLSTQNQTMSVGFDISESYKIKIPASLPLKKNASGKFEGTAEIWANPQLSSNKSLKVVMSTLNWGSPLYYNGDEKKDGHATELTRAEYNVTFNNTAETVVFTVTPAENSVFKLMNNENLPKGILILSTGTETTSEINFLANAGDLPAGTYSYPQTFYVWAG